MTVKTKPFDSSEYLETPEDIHEYLKAICEEGDSDLFLIALGHIAKAKGMTEIARLSGLSRQNLYWPPAESRSTRPSRRWSKPSAAN